MFELENDDETAKLEKLLQNLNVILRVLSSWRQKVSVTSVLELELASGDYIVTPIFHLLS